MKKYDTTKVLLSALVAGVAAPIMIGVVTNVAGIVYNIVTGTDTNILHKRKSSKVLKDGSIIEYDGNYYKVEKVEEA